MVKDSESFPRDVPIKRESADGVTQPRPGGSLGAPGQAGDAAHVPPFLRHAPLGERLRHPHRAVAARAQGCEHHADLHACHAAARPWGAQSTGWVGVVNSGRPQPPPASVSGQCFRIAFHSGGVCRAMATAKPDAHMGQPGGGHTLLPRSAGLRPAATPSSRGRPNLSAGWVVGSRCGSQTRAPPDFGGLKMRPAQPLQPARTRQKPRQGTVSSGAGLKAHLAPRLTAQLRLLLDCVFRWS